MSNDNVFERFWKLQTQINRLVLEGKRDPNVLIDFYQKLLETPIAKTVEWKIRKTIELGTFKNVEEIRKALKAGGHFTSDCANDMLGKPAFKVSEIEQDVELVEVSNEELCFKDGARYADTCKRAFERGFEYCPAEVGPQWCLQCDLPKGTFVVVAMKAISDSDGDLRVFYVGHHNDGLQYLDAGHGNAGTFWRNNVRFLFLRRKTA